MISATQLRPGMVIKFNNELYSVFSVTHRTPGNLRGFVQAKMRSLRSGTMTEHRFSSEDKVEKAMLDEQEMEYLYDDGEYYYFMNTETYEQMHLMKDLLGDATQYLIPQLKVSVEFYEGKPISVELPATVDMTVVETEPGLKGATVSNVTKPAKMETGLVVQVPAVHHGRRKDPRQHVGRHLPGTRVVRRAAQRPSCSRAVRLLRPAAPFAGRAPAARFRCAPMTGGSPARSRVPLRPTFAQSERDQPRGERLVGCRAAADHGFPGIISASRSGKRASSASARRQISRGCLADHGERGNVVPSLQQQVAQRGFERLVDHLIDAQGAEQRIAAQARDDLRLCPRGCRPADRRAVCRR